MKNLKIISFFSLVILVGINNSLVAQGYLLFTPDSPSNVQSGLLVGAHVLLTNNEKKLTKEFEKFSKLYAARLLHQTAFGGSYKDEIVELQESVSRRITLLLVNNSKLSWVNYSKRRVNKEILFKVVSKLQLINENFLLKFQKGGVRGEKYNAYLNFARSMMLLNKELDIVESNIDKSRRLHNIVKSIKN